MPDAGVRTGTLAEASTRLARIATALTLGMTLAVASPVTTALPWGAGAAPAAASTGTIGPGSEARIAITALQLLLLRLGWSLGIDGVLGPPTEAALRQFQQVNRLPVTGVLDDATRTALGDPRALGFTDWEALAVPPVLEADPLARIVTIADRTGFDWRGVGGTYVYGCPPSELSRCTLGAYVPATRTMYVSRGAFKTQRLLEYVVLHEQAHLWQFTTCPPPLRTGCLAPFGLSGIEALQAGADCLAIHWGSRFRGYYACPAEAIPVVAELYLSTLP